LFFIIKGVFEFVTSKLGCYHDKLNRSSDLINEAPAELGNAKKAKEPTTFSIVNSSISPVNRADNSNSNLVTNNSDIKMLNPQGNTTTDFGRKKFSLGKGYSLMDWIRLTKTTPDLAGNGGVMRQITYEELAKHNTENDCWMAINNKVYNVTPYIKFHPGGVDEIMKGAGINATAIFNDVSQFFLLRINYF